MLMTKVTFIIDMMREKNLWQWKIIDPIQKTVVALNKTEFDATKAVEDFIKCYESTQGNYIIVKVNNDNKILKEEEGSKSDWSTFYTYLGEATRPESIGKFQEKDRYYIQQDTEARKENDALRKQFEVLQDQIRQEKIDALHARIKELEEEQKRLNGIIEEYEIEEEIPEIPESPFEKMINGIFQNEAFANVLAAKLISVVMPEAEVKLKQVAGPDIFEIGQFESVLKRILAIDPELLETLETVAQYAEKSPESYNQFKATIKQLAK